MTYNMLQDKLRIEVRCSMIAFYRAMHFSAKRGIAIACRPSVCLSVRLSVCLSVTLVDQDHIGRKSWKLIARTLSPTPQLFGAQRSSTYSQGNMGKFWGDQRWGGKNGALEHKSGNISETRKDREKVTMGGLQQLTVYSPSLFRTVPSPTPYGLPFPKIGGSHPTQNSNRYYLRNG